MGTLTQQEREARQKTMVRFGMWLKSKEKSQRWGAEQLGVYHGYLSNLITGKNTASEETCIKAQRMMQTPKKVRKPSTRKAKPAWTVVTFDELERYRKRRGLSKKAMADLCGVTNSTYHNWQRGTCAAFPRIQRHIRKVIDGSHAQYQPARQPAPVLHEAQLNAIRTVVCAYIESNPEMTPDTLVDVVGAVAGCFRS